MSRSYKAIAETAISDLYEAQAALDNMHAIFTLMLQHFPEDSTGNAFAQLGTLESNDWSTKIYQWCECMENELDDANQEAAVAISAERAHATRWWTHLSEMRRRKELPDWVAPGIGTHDEHDQMLESRKAVNQALFGSDDLGGDQQYRAVVLE
jgi:hypothetical protein